METQCHSYLSRSHLLKMGMFAQRAVDYSIKSYELRTSEIHQLFLKHDKEWRELNRRIAERGRALIADGTLSDGTSQQDDCVLRIYSALQGMYTAAAEIAHSAAAMVANTPGTPSPQLGEVGRYVNSLVRVCTVALFKEEVRHAREALFNHRRGRWFELVLCQIRCLLVGNPLAQAKYELAIIEALEHIREHAYEVARALSSCAPEDRRLESARDSRVQRAVLARGVAASGSRVVHTCAGGVTG